MITNKLNSAALAVIFSLMGALEARAQAGLAWRQALAESEGNGNLPEVADINGGEPLRPTRNMRCAFLRRLDIGVSRGLTFLLSAQREDGSWGVGTTYSPGWDETHMRVPITAQVLLALRESGRPPGREYSRGWNFVSGNMLRTRDDLAFGEVLPGNNDTPYALAYSLNLFLSEYESATGNPRAELRRNAQTVIDAMQRTSWRYVTSGGGQATFQLAIMAEPLLRARGLGFTIPPAPSSGSYTRPTDDQTMPGVRQAVGAVSAGLSGSLGGPFAAVGTLAAGNPPHATRQTATAPGAATAPARPRDMLDLILDLIAGSRGPTGTFGYRAGRSADTDSSDGAARSVLCERLLSQAGHPGAQPLEQAVGRFMRIRPEMERFLQTTTQVTHDSNAHTWARYYYMPGMQWTVDSLLASRDRRANDGLVEMGRALLDIQDRERGSWVDSPQASGPSYGTATAVLLLRRIRARLTTEEGGYSCP